MSILLLERSGLCHTPALPGSECVIGDYRVKIDVLSNEVSPGIPVIIFLSSHSVDDDPFPYDSVCFFRDHVQDSVSVYWQGNSSETKKFVRLRQRVERSPKAAGHFSKGIPTVPLNGSEALLCISCGGFSGEFRLPMVMRPPIKSVIVGNSPSCLLNYAEFQNLILFGNKDTPKSINERYEEWYHSLPEEQRNEDALWDSEIVPDAPSWLGDHFSPVEIERIVAAARQNDPLALILLFCVSVSKNPYLPGYSPQYLKSSQMPISEILRRSENIPVPAREYIYICVYEELRQRGFEDAQIVKSFPAHPAMLRSFFSQRTDAISQRINAGFASSPATEFTIYQKTYHLRYYIIVIILIITAVQIYRYRKNCRI